MYLIHEEAIKKDVDRIRGYLIEMATLAEKSLQESVKAWLQNNHKLAYTIILKDQFIDEKEKEIDRLCLEFMVRHQPVAEYLRFAFSAIKLNVEIERVGDYAESIARYVLKIKEPHEISSSFKDEIITLANTAIEMFHNAISAFIEQSPEKAKETLRMEDQADSMRDNILNKIIKKDVCILESTLIILNIIRRFERVADQSRNICMELLYLFTGEYVKHLGSDLIRVLFVDKDHSFYSHVAECIANSLNKERFVFSSAGIEPQPLDPFTIDFLKKKGFEDIRTAERAIDQIPNLNFYQVIVAFSSGTTKLIPQHPRKTIYLCWEIDESLLKEENDREKNYEKIYQYIKEQIEELVVAIESSLK